MARQTRASRLRESVKQIRIVARQVPDQADMQRDLLARAEDLERLADHLGP